MLRNIAISLTATTLLATSSLAWAEAWYEIEVFAFERQVHSNERWDHATPPKQSKLAFDVISPLITQDVTGVASALNGCTSSDWASGDTTDCNNPTVSETKKTYPDRVPVEIASAQPANAYMNDQAVLLARSQGQFADIISKVSRESGVKPIVHLTWQQNIQDKRNAKPMRIFGGRNFAKQFEYHGQQVNVQNKMANNPQSEYAALASSFQAPVREPVWEFDGNLNIYLNHYLYIEHDFALRKETQKMMDVNQSSNSQYATIDVQGKQVMSPFLKAISLKQHRRVKSGELHYFDHPQMGIVMQIRRMDQPTSVRPLDLSVPRPASNATTSGFGSN